MPNGGTLLIESRNADVSESVDDHAAPCTRGAHACCWPWATVICVEGDVPKEPLAVSEPPWGTEAVLVVEEDPAAGDKGAPGSGCGGPRQLRAIELAARLASDEDVPLPVLGTEDRGGWMVEG